MKSRPLGIRREAASEGFIIVAVLWILGALAALAVVYAMYIGRTTAAVRVNDDRLQAEALISASLELTAYQLTAGVKEARPFHGGFRFHMGKATVTARFLPENARIDLNAAPGELIAGLFVALGAQPDDAKEYADRIIAWRTPSKPQNQNQDTKSSSFGTAGPAYTLREAAFPDALELWLVRGIPASLVERALPYFTVYSGRAAIDIVDAAPEVIAALPGMTANRLNDLPTQRNSPLTQEDPKSLQPVLGALGLSLAAAGGGNTATRVIVWIDFDNGRRVGAEAVILPTEDADEPYRVLSWHDDFDQVTPKDQL